MTPQWSFSENLLSRFPAEPTPYPSKTYSFEGRNFASDGLDAKPASHGEERSP